jgi:hypothetical protein
MNHYANDQADDEKGKPVADPASRQPEALATFAAAAAGGAGKKPLEIGLHATHDTAPLHTDSGAKDEAATRVLQEGVTGEDKGADEAIDALPDRSARSRERS